MADAVLKPADRAPERDAEVAVMNCAFDPESVEFTPAEWLALNTQKADRITELEQQLASVTAEKKAETKAVLDCTRAMRLMQDEINALKKAIQDAPHAMDCSCLLGSDLACDCWKASSLGAMGVEG